MARKIETTVICDLEHDGETPASQTVRFAVGDTAYELDACPEHADRMAAEFATYTTRARRTGNAPRGAAGSANGTVTRSPAIRDLAQQRRRWLTGNGHVLAARGRIPEDLLEHLPKHLR
jgi:hypothetical protein